MPHMPRTCTLLLCVVALFAIAGCEQEAPPPPTPTSTQPTESELASVRDLVDESTPKTPALPPGHPSIDHPTTDGGMPQSDAPPAALVYDAPESWVREPVQSRMRIDQYRLPAASEDDEDGELTVFYFGASGGGGVEANLARWRGQFTTTENEPVPDDAVTRDQLEINGLPVTYFEVRGRFHAGAMRMGGQPQEPRDNQRLLAAIVETTAGPWFFKAVGPDATISAHRPAFRAFLNTMRPADGG